MALFEVKFFSEALGMCTSVNVILPQKNHGIGVEGSKGTRDRYPVLYLLHGASDDHTIWLRRTNIERYVSSMDLAVVMPEVLLSRYENMLHGPKYNDYITQELPQVMSQFFPISTAPEDQFIAGLSMGGMGSLKIGLSKPEQYAAVGVFSSGNLFYRKDNLSTLIRPRESGGVPISEAIYGTTDQSTLRGTAWDPFKLAEENLAQGKKMPRFFHVCGTEDFLIDSARITRDWFAAHPQIDYTYQEAPGAHTWEFWNTWVQAYLKWLNL
ncbi:MAG: esterase family protein [Firmicutes bacterium]|nr:esterase family protein [Bacillota bacterium]